ncbi:MAG: MFS transporter [Desulfarculaceae bacterium]|nr:MFS transporter [Desulfarculaceae bacterium]MCF8071667.1 MFS transporter [Desulfarculaceae bacterium]MCF8102486.1 MFS transporter [Desulfarculaceae bacterium]MCF8114946.1 MFS transporter [Desulfarculaceae bacterium]
MGPTSSHQGSEIHPPQPRGWRNRRAAKGKGPIYYGWYVVVMAFAANFAAAATQFYAFNAFMLPLCAERGWTRADINLAPIVGYGFGLAGQYFYGAIIGRIGPRRFMTIGALVSATAFICLGQVEDLLLFYVAYTMVILGNAAMASLVANTAVSNWFVQYRGRALGMATSGLTLAGVIIPFAAHHLLHVIGLNNAFLTIGLAIGCLSPLAWLVVRDSPESKGLHPDGRIPATADPPSGPSAMEVCTVPIKVLVKTGSFWRVGLAYGLASAGVFAVVFQLGPRFQDLGYDGSTAMLLVTFASIAGTCGKFTWGFLCDRFPPSRLAAVMFCLVGVGQIMGLIASGPVTVGLFILIFGFGMGGIMSTFPIMTAWCFGRHSFASVFRVLALFLSLQAVGYVAMGQTFRLTGSYDAAYLLFVFIDLGAAAMVLGVKPTEAAIIA